MIQLGEGWKGDECAWCQTFKRSAIGTCSCKEPCGIITCPLYDPDDYTPPPVPTFKRTAPKIET